MNMELIVRRDKPVKVSEYHIYSKNDKQFTTSRDKKYKQKGHPEI